MCFVLFEKDSWPAGSKRTQTFHPSGSSTATGSVHVEYRSSDNAYANLYYSNAQTTFNRDFNIYYLGRVFDRCIEFNTQYDY
jgi:hypothetical protein